MNVAPALPGPASGVVHLPSAEERERGLVASFSSGFCQAVLETVVGMRPIRQLAALSSPAVFAKIEARSQLLARVRAAPVERTATAGALALAPAPVSIARVLRTLPCKVRPGIWEVSVVVKDRTRVRAIALRAESHRGRWIATCLEIG